MVVEAVSLWESDESWDATVFWQGVLACLRLALAAYGLAAIALVGQPFSSLGA